MLAAGLALAAAFVGAQEPLLRAHAHNDYEHPRPLLDALGHGFCSVEADIFAVEGQLLIGHDPEDLTPERTLEDLYLKPLHERVQKNEGWVYRKGVPFVLLIDFKTDARATWELLAPMLKRYESMLTRFEDREVKLGAVTVVLSGNRPVAQLKEQRVRLAGIDGRLGDLDGPFDPSLMPMVSADWMRTFRWYGVGSIPAPQLQLLREHVRRVRSKGAMIRFWATPDVPEVWELLQREGVDLINTDDLPGLSRWLQENPPRARYTSPLQRFFVDPER